MEFLDDEWVNLFYLSTLAKHRKVETVIGLWNLPEERVDMDELERELNRLHGVRIFEKESGELYRANIDSQPFHDEIRVYIEQEDYQYSKDVQTYIDFLKKKGNREKLLSIQKIQYYYDNPYEAKENPANFFVKLLRVLDEREDVEGTIKLKEAEEIVKKAKENKE